MWYCQYFTEWKIIAKPLDCKINNYKNQEVLTSKNTLLRKIKSCIDNNLCLAKVNMIDPTKDHFTQLMSIKEIIDELKISKDDYYKALSISKEDLKLDLKRQPNSCWLAGKYGHSTCF